MPEAFAHPAKMSRGLTVKIFKHALSQQWIKPCDVVVDPFGGIGSTGIIGASLGLRVICVELEEKFVKLGKENFELNAKAFEVGHFGHAYQPVIIQGDSRKLSEVIAGADCVVGSPPFQGSLMTKDEEFNAKARPGRTDQKSDYGQTPGQLGKMKPGSVDAVVSSPPYAEINTPNISEKAAKKKTAIQKALGSKRTWGTAAIGNQYGTTPGNLGNLKPGEVDAVVSSPPYQKSDSRGAGKMSPEYLKKFRAKEEELHGKGHSSNKYIKGELHEPDSEGQLGQQEGETFWQAAKQIVAECHQILRPGGYAIWVVKAFVRKGKIVDFPGDWRRLCEAQGFETVHEHHAMLVKETRKPSLFGHEIIEKKERKSFFRRLAESKGSPAIDYETVLCMKKV